MDVLVKCIVRRLGLEEFSEFEEFDGVKDWVGIFEKNLIYNVACFKRLNAEGLAKLGLPLLLEEELARILEHPSFRRDNSRIVTFDAPPDKYTHDTCCLDLSNTEIQVIKQSWKEMLKQSSIAQNFTLFSETFYPLFFKSNPSAKRLFNSDLTQQNRSLTNMLRWIVNNITNLQNLLPILELMGGRHEIYGVIESDYESFGQAIGETFCILLNNNSEELKEVWRSCIVQFGKLMRRAGSKVKMGYRGVLKREKFDGTWESYAVSLTLDVIYFFADSKFTEVLAQFSLRDMDGMNFDGGSPCMIQLVSSKPPSVLKVIAENESKFEDWVFELEWRLKALKRVNAEGPQTRRARRKTVEFTIDTRNNKKKSKKQKRRNGKETNFNAVDVDENEIALVTSSWEQLTELPPDYILLLFETFYKNFFQENPSGKRLFDTDSFETLCLSLKRMLDHIVRCLSNQTDLQRILNSLGGRHEIYGVGLSDYDTFNRTLCDTLEHANPTIFTPEAKSAWSNVLTKISTLMYNAGKVHKSLVLKTTVFRKLQKNSQWKKSVLSLSLDTLYLYQDETSSKLRSTFQLTDVTSIYRNFVSTVTCSSETSTTSSNPSPPLSPTSSGVTHSHSSSETASPVMQFPDLSPPSTHPFSLGICLTKSQYKTPHFYVSFQTREEALTWMEELEWRLQATSKSKSEEKNSAKKKKKGMSSKMVSSLLIKT
eukprot:TRINITY_DN4634_c0_g2_i3.p1 TRINITY_DN4634_c0_g2~~TRINITY_DN4634_c0_g2_i3.p1  ORF type:complete len:724 (-),score=182.35 TRINITY_DN4634_c0_g2_i3:11-2140(-)